ncbi:hypothetical protein SCHPADRAFT_897967 [Schizopora paradoxa]|uniref:Methyltransferase domain-containing protein n=1 Tax=Schizopora paradoxa TaxID=27342 RepID=A0A0H2S8V6_9AGAM|nr:hypothetical protein SCHPADRAFT_897967 [Schizopora paradoxa]
MTESSQTETKTPRFSELKLDFPYDPSDEQVVFFKKLTGISDDEELKNHVLSVQEEAWKVAHYMCIRTFGFMKLSIVRQKKYPDLLKLGKENPQAIYLEFACCFGNDARKAISDGYPLHNVVTSDIEKPFWDLGHKLFKTTPETFPVPFVHGSVFDPLLIAPHEPFYESPLTPRPVLSTLTSLTPLQGHVSAIHVAAFFHLFDKEEQITAARALASLLSPVPGSFIFGGHGTQPKSGAGTFKNFRGKDVHCFSPEDWASLWDGEIFKKGTVEVKYEMLNLKEIFKNSDKVIEQSSLSWGGTYLMWSVTRL